MQRWAPRADRFVASRRLPGGECRNDFLPILFTPTEEHKEHSTPLRMINGR